MKTPKKLIIFGTANTATFVHYYFVNDSDYVPAAFCADSKFITKDSFLELPLLPFNEIEKKFSPKEYSFFCAVGGTELNKIRKDIYLKAKAKGYSMAGYISSKAEIAKNVKIGEHCFIGKVKIFPNSTIGENCIIMSDISHDSNIGAHCFITTNVSMGGMLKIGEQTCIGLNATIRDKIEIGEKNIIGAGTIILSSTAANAVFIQQATKPLKITSEAFLKFESMREK